VRAGQVRVRLHRAGGVGSGGWELAVYRASGVTILVCIAVIYPLSSVNYSLLVLETVMLVSFGLSWFVKGRKILSGG